MTPAPDPSSPPPLFHGAAIAIGGLRVARDGGILRTFLGSCVGVALHDPRRRIAGLAHVMLPESLGHEGPPGKFADTAVAELLRLLDARSAAGRAGLVAKLAGGAQMFPFAGDAPVGARNVRALERILEDLGVPVVGRDCGGNHGRRMSLDVVSGIVTIEVVGAEPLTI